MDYAEVPHVKQKQKQCMWRSQYVGVFWVGSLKPVYSEVIGAEEYHSMLDVLNTDQA